MKLRLLFLTLLVSVSSQAQFKKYFTDQTLRVDYYHSGTVDAEYYMTDELLKEGPWAGPRKNLIDPFDYGSYRYLVFDSASNALIFSRGYSSLFFEYRSTEEAKSQCGNYPESILMPWPKHTVRIEFESRNKQLVWEKQYELIFNPSTTEVNTAQDTFYPSQALLKSGKPKKKVDLVFLPEGYTEEEMDDFREDCNKFMAWLFDTDPYDEYRDKFNIWMVLAPSEESGTDIPEDSVYRSTLLNCGFGTFGSDRYLTTRDFKSVRNVAANAPYDQVVILVNSEKYGGGGIYNFWAISTTDNVNSDLVFTHEFGHAFPGLGDEYYDSEVAVQGIYPLEVEPWEPNITTLVDFKSKWQDMLLPGTPIPTPANDEWKGKTGVFEGGGYVSKGVYRPYLDCSMNVIKFNNFCPVCKRATAEMIEFYCK